MAAPPLELWAGVECTIARIGDRCSDQLARTTFWERTDDLRRIAGLGVRAVRFPVIWEWVERMGARAWPLVEERLELLRAAGVEPIVGLVHHGSGPADTSLIDPAFPRRVAGFAAEVAGRFPWVTRWTPINEPLTTARFAALYGVWYPHARDDRKFLEALLVELEATRLAMRAIRRVTPGALLVQTEDLARTWSTPTLGYQAAFENERRWLSLDLLTGRLKKGDPMWRYATDAGIAPARLLAWAADPCPPDIVGVNHYVTSERFLDERMERYPAWSHGGNGRHRYADVEAPRVLREGNAGHAPLLLEAWERYRLPLAITEVHLGGPRDEQIRWLRDAWEAACRVRAAGADVRAVTVWSAYGAFDWNTLLVQDVGFYESGLWDLRAPEPRPTAIARMARDLAARGAHDHPVLDGEGWWHRDDRYFFTPADEAPGQRAALPRTPSRPKPRGMRPLLVVGARGTLARQLVRSAAHRGLPVVALGRDRLDVTDAALVRRVIAETKPWAVVNTAGYVRVDDAETEFEECRRLNADGAANVAAACAELGVPLATYSSDLVFDGTRDTAYVEHHAPNPLNVYGRSKAEAERRVLEAHPGALVVRTSAFFGPDDDHNFVTIALREMSAGRPFQAAGDTVVSPTYVPDLADATLDLVVDGATGLWHLANTGAVSWAELARSAARRFSLDPSLVEEVPFDAFALPAPRPRRSALASERGTLLGDLDRAMDRYADAVRGRLAASGR